MFGRTFSFWRQLVHKTQPLTMDAQTDRRLWVRFPADLQTNVQLEEGPVAENRVSAKVRDISHGGANLLVERPFEVGQMLTLELPQESPEDSHTVLACVVRVFPAGAGQWALGCIFSRELSADDLEGFEATPVRQAPSDQRTSTRYTTNLGANFQKIGDPDNLTYSAQVLNVSASGVGLEVTLVVDAGALLSVDLRAADGKVVRTILACVVHVTTLARGRWALGCNFIRELSEEDLEALV
jgi:hypothetical protein